MPSLVWGVPSLSGENWGFKGSSKKGFFYEENRHPEVCGLVYRTSVVSKAMGVVEEILRSLLWMTTVEEGKEILPAAEPDRVLL